jgi:hypothetical protein
MALSDKKSPFSLKSLPEIFVSSKVMTSAVSKAAKAGRPRNDRISSLYQVADGGSGADRQQKLACPAEGLFPGCADFRPDGTGKPSGGRRFGFHHFVWNTDGDTAWHHVQAAQRATTFG